MLAEIVNHRFWLPDFEVYYKAADRILHGQNLYKIVGDRHYVFKYSPTSAIYFIPFLVFPFAIAKYIYWLLLTAIIVVGFHMCISLLKPSLFLNPDSNEITIVVLGATLILALHFLRELHLGQVNYLLLFIYITALKSYREKRGILFALLLALSIFIKPFTLIFIPFLILKKKYAELAIFTVFCLSLFLLPVLFYGSAETTLNQYLAWFSELQIELSHKQSLLQPANHTLFSVFARYTPVRYLITSSLVVRIYQIIMLSLIGFLFIWFSRINNKNSSHKQKQYYSVIEFSLLVSLIPLLAFTSENAYIYTQILVFTILLYFRNLKAVEKGLAIVAFVFIGGNFGELLGKTLSKLMDDLSLISLGTIVLIYLLFALRIRGSLEVEQDTALFSDDKLQDTGIESPAVVFVPTPK